MAMILLGLVANVARFVQVDDILGEIGGVVADPL